MHQQTIIEVKNLRRTFKSIKKEEGLKGSLKLLFNPQYQEKDALKTVSFNIEAGTFIGLIGANGAGKTTLLKILSGLIPPTSGSARVLGQDPFKRTMGFRKNISLVMGQKAQLWWDLPAVDAFDLLKAIFEIPDGLYRSRLGELSELLDVKKLMQTQIRRLSLGERMKMELIGALLHWPKVIFLDEPTIGLDVLAAHKLREFLKIFNQKEKATILLTSHNMDDIERLCPRVMILREGAMIFDGNPSSLKKEGQCQLRVRLAQNPSIQELALNSNLDERQILISSDDEITNIRFSINKDQVVNTLHKLMDKYSLIDMGIEEESLEAVIQKIFGEASLS